MESESGAPGEPPFAWPLCPVCGERRSARCRVCGASRTDFRPADYSSFTSQHHLLVCDDCDDVMLPDWYRRCAACGHDFADGIEPALISTNESAASNRIWLVAVLLAAATFALILFFAWLFSTGG